MNDIQKEARTRKVSLKDKRTRTMDMTLGLPLMEIKRDMDMK